MSVALAIVLLLIAFAYWWCGMEAWKEAMQRGEDNRALLVKHRKLLDQCAELHDGDVATIAALTQRVHELTLENAKLRGVPKTNVKSLPS